MAGRDVSTSGSRFLEPSCPCCGDTHTGEPFVVFARGVLENLHLPWMDLDVPASRSQDAAAQATRPSLQAPGTVHPFAPSPQGPAILSHPGKRRRDASATPLPRPAANETADASMSGCMGYAPSGSRRFGTLVDAAEERHAFLDYTTGALPRVARTVVVYESMSYWRIRDAVEAAVAAGQIG